MHKSVGRAIALGLATHGAKIVCCDLQGQANQEGYERDLEKTTAEAIEASGGEAIFVQADISNTQQVEEAFRLAIEVNGHTGSGFNRLHISNDASRHFIDWTFLSIAPVIGHHSGSLPMSLRTCGQRWLL